MTGLYIFCASWRTHQSTRLVARCGERALMAKTDLLSVYRHVPVHPSERHLLGIEREGKTYCDKALPFGLHSALKLFSAIADSLSWALQCEEITNSVHYLDDFCSGVPQEHPSASKHWPGPHLSLPGWASLWETTKW